MNETQRLIKNTIENTTRKNYSIEVLVEYVDNVDKQVQKIENQFGTKFRVVYDATNLTGTFVPAVNKNPYYIIVKSEQNDMMYVKTAFHEYQHLIDYIRFKDTVFDGDIETMKNSPLYVTFNVYSEYAATLFGTKKYIEIVKLDDMSQKELAEAILQSAKEIYWKLEGIVNRYQLLVHSMQYIGNIVACGQFSDEIDTQNLISEMELSEELYPILGHVFMYEDKYKWYEDLDKMMRNFVDGGVES